MSDSPIPQQLPQPQYVKDEAVPCVFCGYNLWGLSSPERCPECGAPARLSGVDSSTIEPVEEIANPIDMDLTCIGCQSELRGRRFHQQCTTCGAPVWFTAPLRLLHQSSVGWLTRVRSGVNLWIVMIFVGFALALTSFIVTIIIAVISQGDQATILQAGLYGGSITEIISGILYVLVVWKLTTPNPTVPPQSDPRTLRGVMRLGSFLSLLAAIITLSATLFQLPEETMWIASALGLAFTGVVLGLCVYLRALAVRIPDASLIRQLSMLMWVLFGTQVSMQLSGMLSMVTIDAQAAAPPGMGPPFVTLIQLTTCFFVFLLFGAQIWLLTVLFRLRRALRVAVERRHAVGTSEQNFDG